MMISGRSGMHSQNILNYWAMEWMVVYCWKCFIEKCNATEPDRHLWNNPWNLRYDGMKSGNERQLRIFHYTDRGKKWEHYLGAFKNSWITFIMIEWIHTWAVKNSCLWLVLKKTFLTTKIEHRMYLNNSCTILFIYC